MRRSSLLSLIVLSLTPAACGSDGGPAGPSSDALEGVARPAADAGGASGGNGPDAAASAGDGGSASEGGGPQGLPCEVSALLGTYCVSCHGTTPMLGVPVSLVSYADLTSPFPGNKSITTAESARQSLESGRMPPPGGARPTSAEIAAFAAWVSAGTPETACATGAVVDPFAGASVCTSGSYWRSGEGEKMRPGDACVSCHLNDREAPDFNVGGTVYPTGHEPDLCEGVKDVRVELTDANGVVHTYDTNSAGNFSNHEEAEVAVPYTAKLVTSDGRTRSMLTPQTSGDCNGCHTEKGTQGAPGRIVMPL